MDAGQSPWDAGSPASEAAIQALAEQSGLELPNEYLDFLRQSNGGCGPLRIEPGWLQLWPAEEVVAVNRDYEVALWLPGLFGFGSSGGGELLAFDTRFAKPWRVVMVPFCDLTEESVLPVADSFAALIRAIESSVRRE